jgi:hypothetical protein
MSTGHLHGEEKKSDAELYQMLGEADTASLYAGKVTLDTSHDVPYAGGVSVDGKTVYIDRMLYRDVMDGNVSVRGMTGRQVIQAFIEHEHTEWAIDCGDNPVDTYPAAHAFATAKEERFVKQIGVNPERYEAAIRPALERCVKCDPANPPRDLWCGPYLDDPTPRDKELLRILRAKNVADAFKASKIDAGYGIGARECKDCRYFGGGELAQCEKVCGLVRANRQCKWWTKNDR